MEVLNNSVTIVLDETETKEVLKSLSEIVHGKISGTVNKEIVSRIYAEALKGARKTFGEIFYR